MATVEPILQGTVPKEAVEERWRFDVFARLPWLKGLVRMRS